MKLTGAILLLSSAVITLFDGTSDNLTEAALIAPPPQVWTFVLPD